MGRLCVVVGALLTIVHRPADAQDNNNTRRGVWLGLAMGYGSARFSCDTCLNTPGLGGWTITGGLGLTPSNHVRVGIEWRQWVNGLKESQWLQKIESATLLLSYYPRIHGGPVIEAGGGLASYLSGTGTGNPLRPISRATAPSFSGTGWGVSYGAGWEVVWGRHSVTPRVIYARGQEGTIHAGGNGGVAATGWHHHAILIDLSVR